MTTAATIRLSLFDTFFDSISLYLYIYINLSLSFSLSLSLFLRSYSSFYLSILLPLFLFIPLFLLFFLIFFSLPLFLRSTSLLSLSLPHCPSLCLSLPIPLPLLHFLFLSLILAPLTFWIHGFDVNCYSLSSCIFPHGCFIRSSLSSPAAQHHK